MVIVGGGPVGVGLAIDLGLRGIPWILVERYATPQSIPKGQNLTQRTMEHFIFGARKTNCAPHAPYRPTTEIGGITIRKFTRRLQLRLAAARARPPILFHRQRTVAAICHRSGIAAKGGANPAIKTMFGWACQESDGIRVMSV